MSSLGRRRLVLGAAVGAASLMGRPSFAQRPRLIKIGALTESWGPTPAIVGLRDGLVQLGHRENEDFAIGVRFTEGKAADLPVAARELVRLGVDIIVTADSGATARAAQAATTQVPIVVTGSGNPVDLGLVKSLARPGGNVTGVADLDADLVPKRMEIFRDLVTGLKRIAVPYDETNREVAAVMAVHRDAAARLGLSLVERPVRTEPEAREAIAALRKDDVNGLFSLRFLSLNIPGFILDLAARQWPTMFHVPFFVERGGLASYSANTYELGRQAARLVDKIIKGAKPADLPVEQPTKFELIVNLKTAKVLGLTLPPSQVVRADRIIE